jgi:[acyl-carrier-protein] S-malonyltransferase
VLVSEAIVTHEAPRVGFPHAAASGPPDDTPTGTEPSDHADAPVADHATAGPLADVANGAAPARARWLTAAVRHLFEVVTTDVVIDEDRIRRYYRVNRDRYHQPERRHVRHVLTRDRDTAERVRRLVADGADMAALARTHSQDRGSRHRGGDLGDLRRGVLTGALEDLVFAAHAGQVAGPARTEFGWHVVRVERITPARTAPYPQVHAEIRVDLLAAERGRAFDDWFETRRRELVVIEPDWRHPGDPSLPDSVHRH